MDLQGMFVRNQTQTERVAYAVLVALVVALWSEGSALQERSLSREPEATIRRCVQNMTAQIRNQRPVRFQERIDAPWGSEIRDVILTKDGRVDRLIAIADQSLTPAQQEKEIRRLNSLLQRAPASPLLHDQDEEKQRRMKLVAAIPKAFSYQVSPLSEPNIQESTEPDIQELAFSPAKSFHPENRETKIYQGIQGTMRIDTLSNQLLRVEGTVFRNVPFGWGILGKLHRGGRFRIEQQQVLPDRWEITETTFDFTYTVFFFSTSHYIRKTTNSSFVPIDPNTRLADAIRLLLAESSSLRPRSTVPGPSTNTRSPLQDSVEWRPVMRVIPQRFISPENPAQLESAGEKWGVR